MKAKILSFALLLLLFTALPACGGGSSLATTPLDVHTDVAIGMNLYEVYDLIDPEYGNEACWIVDCSEISIEGGTVYYTPTDAIDSPYFMWIFMPRFSTWAQATAVFFEYSEPTGGVVIACVRMDYDKAQNLIALWGSRTFW